MKCRIKSKIDVFYDSCMFARTSYKDNRILPKIPLVSLNYLSISYKNHKGINLETSFNSSSFILSKKQTQFYLILLDYHRVNTTNSIEYLNYFISLSLHIRLSSRVSIPIFLPNFSRVAKQNIIITIICSLNLSKMKWIKVFLVDEIFLFWFRDYLRHSLIFVISRLLLLKTTDTIPLIICQRTLNVLDARCVFYSEIFPLT